MRPWRAIDSATVFTLTVYPSVTRSAWTTSWSVSLGTAGWWRLCRRVSDAGDVLAADGPARMIAAKEAASSTSRSELTTARLMDLVVAHRSWTANRYQSGMIRTGCKGGHRATIDKKT